MSQATQPNRATRDFLGSGLSLPWFGLVLLSSVALFALWDGPLWTRPPDASHVGRFAVSYLAVIPVAAIVLQIMRGRSWRHLLTTVGTVWAIKLLVTSAMYTALAGGTATVLRPATAPVPTTDATPPPARYEASSAAFESGAIAAKVANPGPGAWTIAAYLLAPSAGASLPEPREVAMTIRDGNYEQSLYVAAVHDDLIVINSDARLYTAHVFGDDGSPANQTVPPNGRASLPDLDVGLYRLRSDSAVAETWLLVVDHPYATVAENGAFGFANVPTGAHDIAVVAIQGSNVERTTAHITVQSMAPATLEVAF